MTNKIKSYLSAGVAWLVAAWIFIATMNLKSGAGGLIRPELIPRVVAILLIILGIGMFVQGLKEKVSQEELDKLAQQKAERAKLSLVERLTPVLTLVLIFLFLLLLRHVGFTICAVGYLTVQMTLLSGEFSWKSWLKYFIIAVIASVAILLLFRYGFKLKLPVNGLGF